MTKKMVNLFMKNQINGCNVLREGRNNHVTVKQNDEFLFDSLILLIIWL